MADSVNLQVPAGTWTAAVVGPAEALVTANDNFYFAFDDVAPTAVVGHFRQANDDLVAVLPDGQTLWVFNQLRPFRLTATVDAA